VHRSKQSSCFQTKRIARNPSILKSEKLDIGNQATANLQCQVISHTDVATILSPNSYSPLHAILFSLLKSKNIPEQRDETQTDRGSYENR
jgi:hypothetical protein